jgi:SAM-dependent methyltransferase
MVAPQILSKGTVDNASASAHMTTEIAYEPAITFWEKAATTKWGSYLTEVERAVILKAQQLCGLPATALEIGCEGGRWSKMLSEAGWKIICTDINRETLELCRMRIPDATCIQVTPGESTLPCDSASIKLLLCMEVDPVLPGSDWFVEEALRVLQPGGILVGNCLNRLSLRGLFVHHLVPSDNGYDPYKFAYIDRRTKMRAVGFHFFYEEGCGWFPFTRLSNSRLIPLFTTLERVIGLRKIASLSPNVIFIIQKSAQLPNP